MAAIASEMAIQWEDNMKREQRRAHAVIWVVLVPILAIMVWQVLGGKRTVPAENSRPLVKQSEVFK